MPGEVTALLAAMSYAVSNLLVRKGQKDTHPADNGLFPILVITGFILLSYLLIDYVRDPSPMIRSNRWLQGVEFCALSGLIATLLGRLALYRAIAKIGATRGSIVAAMSPLITLGIAITVLQERLNMRDVTGIVMLLSGVLLLLMERKLFPTRFSPGLFVQNGIWLALWATLFQGVGYAFRKIGMQGQIEPAFAGVIDTFAALMAYILILAFLGKLKSYLSYYLTHINLYIISAGFMMATAVFLFFEAVSDVPVSTVSVIMGSQPVIVALLAGIFMNSLERLTWVTAVSAGLVSVGVILLGI
ncbi:DMT family transporter [Alicyclobacillus mengziensis]|uniref:EamA family transporter n=1 Tax=Alicyclobacillus mengziensis TaxID=2931921 RepID=A0A9X7W2W4_9BACL|nr:EamA family transporter [Alicyclobacillus mengziensis]QSO48278.1 EamA family transporter [Alicyclobacillus mengziensis]